MSHTRALVYLHLSVLLFGFTAILGRLISLPATTLVWWRMVITLVSLFFLPKVLKHLKAVPPRDRWKILGIGVLVAAHWVTFYASIKLANVSVALSCFASTAFITAVLEPLILKRPFRAYELGLGIVILFGIGFIFRVTDGTYALGIGVALVSALLAASFSILNKGMVTRYHPYAITLLEFVSGVIFLSLILPFYIEFVEAARWLPDLRDLGLLLVLALLCTTLAYTLSMLALQEVSAFTANLTINLEPLYGIVLAIPFFQENKVLSFDFYLGAAFVLSAVFVNAAINARQRRKARRQTKS